MRKFTLILSLLVVMVTTAMAQITSVDQLSNEKCYSITPKDSQRGVLYADVNSGYLSSCGGTMTNANNASIAVDANNQYQQFAFIDYKGYKFLYSVGAKKFIKDEGAYITLSEDPRPGYVTIEKRNDEFTIKFNNTNDYINISTGWNHGALANWNTIDTGNQFTILEVADFNPEEALVAIEDNMVEVTYVYKHDGKELTRETISAIKDYAYPAPTNLPYGVTAATPQGNASQGAVVDVECTISGIPFAFVDSYDEIEDWYLLTLRGKKVMYDGTAKLVYNTSDISSNDLFAFVGNPFIGYKIYNNKAGKDKIFCNESAGNGTEIAAADATVDYGLWNLSDNNGNYLLIKDGTTNGYLHDFSGKVSYWVSNLASGDPGSYITFSSLETSLKDALAEMEANQKGLNVGFFEYNENTIESINGALSNKNLDEMIDGYNLLTRIDITNGKTYKIISADPRFMDKQGVEKSIYNNNGDLYWGTWDATNKSHYWVAEKNGSTLKLKNYNDQTLYMAHKATTTTNDENKTTTSNDYVVCAETSADANVAIKTNITLSRLTFIAAQYHISAGSLGVFHANGHAAGSGNSYNIIEWNEGANSPSAWRIIEVEDPELEIAKATLENKIAELQVYIDHQGTNVGCFTSEAIAPLAAAVAEAQELLNKEGATKEEYTSEYDNLNTVQLPTTIVLPEEGKFYLLRCDYQNRYIHADADNKMQYAGNSYSSRSVWTFETGTTEGTFKMKNVFTQSYLPTISNSKNIVLADNGADVTLHPSTVIGAIMFTTGNNNIGIHANNAPCIGWTNDAGANHYWFEEITEFSHTISIGDAEWSTLKLGFNAEIPEGVTAYTVSNVDGEEVTLSEVTGVIPANTAVLVNAPKKDYTFTYTTATATAVTGNKLEGVLYNTTITPAGDSYYVLAKVGEDVGLYIVDENPDADGYEAFTLAANKAYLHINGQAESNGFSFRIEGTTGIDEVKGENGNVKAIYDLTGRRVERINAPGIYIINGKKVVVK